MKPAFQVKSPAGPEDISKILYTVVVISARDQVYNIMEIIKQHGECCNDFKYVSERLSHWLVS